MAAGQPPPTDWPPGELPPEWNGSPRLEPHLCDCPMSLDEYRRKRHFSRTPEPPGSEPAARGGNRFVVQQHRARRLHYDFRLELEGVLRSWAVPKGPCLDPKEKRLAVQVEDHPVEYGDFEGAIPAGEYGAGTVLLWDRGTWQAEGDPARDLGKGRLSFTLTGEKLQGGWTLVRTASRGGEQSQQWLLLKRSDAAARRLVDYDVLVEKPLSVLTGRTMDEIAASPKRVWMRQGEQLAAAEAVDWSARVSSLKGARKTSLPNRVTPALAQLAAAAPEGPRWLHEIKFDGYRLLARREDNQVVLLTRGGHDWTARFPELAAELARLPAQAVLLDGELVALRPDGVSGFQELQAALAERRTGTPLAGRRIRHRDPLGGRVPGVSRPASPAERPRAAFHHGAAWAHPGRLPSAAAGLDGSGAD